MGKKRMGREGISREEGGEVFRAERSHQSHAKIEHQAPVDRPSSLPPSTLFASSNPDGQTTPHTCTTPGGLLMHE